MISRQIVINKLVLLLKIKYKITYQENDDNLILNNVIFTRNDKICKIAHEMFFRINGRCIYLSKDDKIEYMNDEMFYDWIKMIILFKLGIENI